MTQQQQINLLTSIMPEISETHDPRGVMLKCAKEHNLSPAQLEKLGHVYNTAKTLVGLEKQAHRGDSFSIVDVPEMVASYTTFDPTKEVAKGSKEVHRRANRLLKYAEADETGYWTRKFMRLGKGVEKAASAKLPTILDDIWEKGKRVVVTNEADGNQWEEIPLPGGARLNSVVKSAAAGMKYVASQMTKAAEDAREAMVDANETSRRMVKEIKDVLVKSGRKEEVWKEMVEDLDDYFSDSREKSASLAHYIESHLEYDHQCRVPHIDLEKRAGRRMIARDRHGIFERADEILECAGAFKEAKALYESLTEASGEGEESEEEKVAALLSAMKQPVEAARMLDIPTTKEQKKWKEEAQSRAKQTAALQQLLLSDPVLQEADPHEVEDIYNTVSSLNSTIASDPKLLGPVLKESLQYGSVPIQMLKDIVSIDKDRQQAEKYREEVKDLKYNK